MEGKNNKLPIHIKKIIAGKVFDSWYSLYKISGDDLIFIVSFLRVYYPLSKDDLESLNFIQYYYEIAGTIDKIKRFSEKILDTLSSNESIVKIIHHMYEQERKRKQQEKGAFENIIPRDKNEERIPSIVLNNLPSVVIPEEFFEAQRELLKWAKQLAELSSKHAGCEIQLRDYVLNIVKNEQITPEDK